MALKKERLEHEKRADKDLEQEIERNNRNHAQIKVKAKCKCCAKDVVKNTAQGPKKTGMKKKL